MGKIGLVFPPGCYELASKQLGQMQYYEFGGYLYYVKLAKFIGERRKILDLGCGLGRNSVIFSKFVDGHYILADSNGDSSYPGWRGDVKEYYNDLELTKTFVEANGLTNYEIFDLEHRELEELEDIDFVFSFLAAGYHFPISQYINRLLDIATPNCLFAFSIRDSAYDFAVERLDRLFYNRCYLNYPFPGWSKGKERLLVMWDFVDG